MSSNIEDYISQRLKQGLSSEPPLSATRLFQEALVRYSPRRTDPRGAATEAVEYAKALLSEYLKLQEVTQELTDYEKVVRLFNELGIINGDSLDESFLERPVIFVDNGSTDRVRGGSNMYSLWDFNIDGRFMGVGYYEHG